MQTVVLAAGEGTRMRPLTATRPKPMLPVAGRPLLEHVLDAAVDGGASRLVLVVGYGEDAVREHFGEAYRDVPVTYAIQESQEGTAHAVRTASPHLEDAPFAVLAGDNLYDAPSVADLYDDGPAIGAYRVEDPRPYGVFELDDAGDADGGDGSDGGDSGDGGGGSGDSGGGGDAHRVTGVVEKPDDPPSDLINASAYVFPPAALDWLDVGKSERGEYELTDVLARLFEEDEVRAVEFERWLDVGRAWELLEANEWMVGELERDIAGDVHESAEVVGDVVVEEGATVRAGAVVEGPALIQSGASVGPNAYVRGATAIGPDAHVGHAVEVKNSVLMEGATVPHLSYVGDSVLGRDVNFGAGTTVANLRHDDEPVRLTVKGERVSTGRRKFGVVVADGVKTAIQTSLNAGVTLSTGATTEPGESVTLDR